MTAEIVIMNKEAVALAADSAVSVTEEGRQKIFTSANKIFALSRYYPVGIMVYGASLFMDVPWETIIKTYREKLKNKKFYTLKKYADDFISFLTKENRLFPESEQEDHFKQYVYSYFFLIRQQIEGDIGKLIKINKQTTQKQIKDIILKIIKQHHIIWKKAKEFSNIPENYGKNLSEKYENLIGKAKKEVFEKLLFSKLISNLLTEIAVCLFTKFNEEITHPGMSGIVITGFGEKDIFPSLRSYVLEGIVNNVLQYKKDKESDVNFNKVAAIIPFAQREMVDAFMEGISPDYAFEIKKYLFEVCNEYPKIIIDSIGKLNKEEKTELKGKFKKISNEWLKKYGKNFQKYREENYVAPVTSVVAMLPKDNLAAMAESLINLTSFKRKVTIEAETVAGPIDVAVISKGDGFIWIKRKHYFKPELNPQYFTRYNKEINRDGKSKSK